MATKIKFPPCGVNPMTEKSYTRHKWVIVQDKLITKPGDPRLYYHVVCERPTCRLNSPNPVGY